MIGADIDPGAWLNAPTDVPTATLGTGIHTLTLPANDLTWPTAP